VSKTKNKKHDKCKINKKEYNTSYQIKTHSFRNNDKSGITLNKTNDKEFSSNISKESLIRNDLFPHTPKYYPLISSAFLPYMNLNKNAFQNLRGISLALGRERTRKELLPYLKSCIDEQEDEIIIELSKVLSNFIDCIGGKQYIKELFNLLEVILTIDEPFVRKETINSIKLIVNQIGKVS